MRTNPSSRVTALERRLVKRKHTLVIYYKKGKYSINCDREYETLEQLKDAEGILDSQNLFIYKPRESLWKPTGIIDIPDDVKGLKSEKSANCPGRSEV